MALEGLFVGLAAILPAGQPAGFAAIRRGELDTLGEDAGGAVGKGCGGVGGGAGGHVFEDLEEAPAAALIAFGGGGAFAFEVDVVDEGEGAFGGGGEEVEVVADAVGVGAGGGEHFGERGAGADADEFGLFADGAAEEAAEFLLPGAGFVGKERRAVVPEAGALHPGGGIDAALAEVGDEAGETFFEGAAAAGGIPDEVADAEGGEVFTGVPTGEAIDGSGAFVLPDAFADAVELSGGEGGGGRGGGGRGLGHALHQSGQSDESEEGSSERG